MSSPQISIIVPIYNVEAWLPRCLDSLCAQEFTDIEIICINDSSPDKSEELAQSYAQKDPRVKVHTRPNGGPGAARNTGLHVAQGKYIMFCDSDDWYAPSMCQVMFDRMEQENVDLVICNTQFEYENDDDQKVQQERRPLSEAYYIHSHSGKKKLTGRLGRKTNVMLWNKIFKADMIRDNGIEFIERCDHDDNAFWLIISQCAKTIYFEPRALHHYFIRSGSIMDTLALKKNKKPDSYILMIRETVAYFNQHPKLMPEKVSFARWLRRQLNYALNVAAEQQKEELVDNIRTYLNENFSQSFVLKKKNNNSYSLNFSLKKWIKNKLQP